MKVFCDVGGDDEGMNVDDEEEVQGRELERALKLMSRRHAARKPQKGKGLCNITSSAPTYPPFVARLISLSLSLSSRNLNRNTQKTFWKNTLEDAKK